MRPTSRSARFVPIVWPLLVGFTFASEPQFYQRKPRSTEWEVFFEEGIKMGEYARQLDYFGIELAAVDKEGKIQYANHLAQRKPQRHEGTTKDETRVNIRWKRGNLLGVDRKLLTKAGIKSKDKEVLHYYPREIEAKLWELERAYGGLNADEIRRTRFMIRPKADGQSGYEFYVSQQDRKAYRSKSSPSASSQNPAGNPAAP